MFTYIYKAFPSVDYWTPDKDIDDTERIIKTTLRRLIFYVCFVIVTTLMVLLIVPPMQYYYTKAIENVFFDTEFVSSNDAEINFPEIKTAADFWRYTETVLVDNLYWDYWYSYEDKISATSADDRKVLYENQLLGAPRIKQVRVKKNSCRIHANFRTMFSHCYGGYSQNTKDEAPFGPTSARTGQKQPSPPDDSIQTTSTPDDNMQTTFTSAISYSTTKENLVPSKASETTATYSTTEDNLVTNETSQTTTTKTKRRKKYFTRKKGWLLREHGFGAVMPTSSFRSGSGLLEKKLQKRRVGNLKEDNLEKDFGHVVYIDESTNANDMIFNKVQRNKRYSSRSNLSRQWRNQYKTIKDNGYKTAWTYSSHSDLDGAYYFGKMATYDSGGYYLDLSLDRATAKEKIKYLKQNLWITRQTRAVFIDFAMYNANLNLFCVVKVVFEYPPIGGVEPSYSIYTVKLIRYFSILDHFVLGLEIVFLCFILYFTVEEFIDIYHQKYRYFTKFWNYIDLIVLIVAYLCIAFSIYRIIIMRNNLDTFKKNPNSHVPFDSLGYWQTQFNNAMAVLLFIVWIKLFKYINLSKTMGQLGYTLARSSKEIIGFSFMFFIVFFAFAQVGYLLFGAQVYAFSTFGRSVLTLLMTILGEFDYEEIEKCSKIFAPIFFALYIFFVFFVLLNMFLAIITDTYSDVKNEIAIKNSGLEIIDVLKRGPRNCCRKMGREVFIRKKTLPGNEIIHNLRKILRICKFSDEQIHTLFRKHDIDESQVITEFDIRAFLAQLKSSLREEDMSQHKRTAITTKQYVSLRNKMDIIEQNVNIILMKLSKITEQLDTYRKQTKEK